MSELRDNSDDMCELNPMQMSQAHYEYMKGELDAQEIQDEQDARREFEDDAIENVLDFDEMERSLYRKKELESEEMQINRRLEAVKRSKMLDSGPRLFDGIVQIEQKRALSSEVTLVDTSRMSYRDDNSFREPDVKGKRKASDVRGRGFCVTIHAPAEHPERVDAFKAQPWTYYILGKEVCPTTGSHHLQGFGYLAQKCSERALRERIPGVHIEAKSPHSTFKQSIDYCKKQDDSPQVYGVPPMDPRTKGETQQTLWAETLEFARRGERDAIHPRIQFLHYQNIDYHRSQALQAQRFEPVLTKHLWCWGKTGTGKSKWVRDTYDPEQTGKFFLKGSGKWWDGYANQEVVLIEDWGLSHVKEIGADLLKIWADVYPFQAEIKGRSFMRIRPRLIIVNSNYKPEDLWSDERELDPILRRFELREFKKLEQFDRS